VEAWNLWRKDSELLVYDQLKVQFDLYEVDEEHNEIKSFLIQEKLERKMSESRPDLSGANLKNA
jgi:hypothetical protein